MYTDPFRTTKHSKSKHHPECGWKQRKCTKMYLCINIMCVHSVHGEHIHSLFAYQYNGLSRAYCMTPVHNCNRLYLDCNPDPSKLYYRDTGLLYQAEKRSLHIIWSYRGLWDVLMYSSVCISNSAIHEVSRSSETIRI